MSQIEAWPALATSDVPETEACQNRIPIGVIVPKLCSLRSTVRSPSAGERDDLLAARHHRGPLSLHVTPPLLAAGTRALWQSAYRPERPSITGRMVDQSAFSCEPFMSVQRSHHGGAQTRQPVHLRPVRRRLDELAGRSSRGLPFGVEQGRRDRLPPRRALRRDCPMREGRRNAGSASPATCRRIAPQSWQDLTVRRAFSGAMTRRGALAVRELRCASGDRAASAHQRPSGNFLAHGGHVTTKGDHVLCRGRLAARRATLALS